MNMSIIDLLIDGTVNDYLNPIYHLEDIFDLLEGKIKINLFCTKCKCDRVFSCSTSVVPKVTLQTYRKNIENSLYNMGMDCISSDDDYRQEAWNGFIKNYRIITLEYQCSMDPQHIFYINLYLGEDKIIKIGQYPSYADIKIPQNKKYTKILGEYYTELNRAIGLYSCQVGIGSFVYLRRIIEKLVYDAFKEAEATSKLTEQQFDFQADGIHRNGMEEKIKLLKGFLPEIITDRPKIYGVVSKGIHELSEEECLKYFPILKDGIVMILDDIVAKKEKEKAIADYTKSLGKIVAELK